MDFHGLIDNITNPALLFFILGILAVQFKSDLMIPENSSKFISVYLLMSIGFKGGQELSHSNLNLEIFNSLLLGIFMAILVPLVSFFVLKRKFSTQNAGAIAAAYGSVSAVTFVTAISFLEMENAPFDGHMVAVMAAMEAPAIIVGVLMINRFQKSSSVNTEPIGKSIIHSFTNGSVLLILGSLLIGFLANEKQAQGIEPFTTDIFKGFLAVFLLDKGISTGKQLSIILQRGIYPFLFASLMPFLAGFIALAISTLITDSLGNRLLFAILAASASYIAVPAAMKTAAPKAHSSLYLGMALGITFPINVIIGIPIHFTILEKISH